MYSTHCVPFIFIIWDICLFEFGVYAFVLWWCAASCFYMPMRWTENNVHATKQNMLTMMRQWSNDDETMKQQTKSKLSINIYICINTFYMLDVGCCTVNALKMFIKIAFSGARVHALPRENYDSHFFFLQIWKSAFYRVFFFVNWSQWMEIESMCTSAFPCDFGTLVQIFNCILFNSTVLAFEEYLSVLEVVNSPIISS